MNERQNIEVIKNVYAAFGAGDVQTILDHVAEDADWTNYGPAVVPYTGSYKGRSEIAKFFEGIANSTTNAKVTADEFIGQDDTVVAIARYIATVRDTGATIDTPLAHIFTLKNGKITRWLGFSDSAKVAAAHTRAAGA